MINEIRFKLQKGSIKYQCPNPNCGKKTYVRYIDVTDGSLLPERYGRCDREIKCSYHLNPYQDGYAKRIDGALYKIDLQIPALQISAKKISSAFIPVDVFKKTLLPEGYMQNSFLQTLLNRVPFPFDEQDIEKVVSLYYLGTVCNGYRDGAVTFPFIDKIGNVCAIQVKQFDEANHTIGTDFIHSIIEKHNRRNNIIMPDWLVAYQKNDLKVSCLFGEHLLAKYLMNPIALVEAPKTAIYGKIYFGFLEKPENLLWMAVYNLSSLNYEKCKALQGRDVFLFPDLSRDGKAYELWSNRAKELTLQMKGTKFQVSDLLETMAADSDRENGDDIADVLVKIDWRAFRSQPVPNIQDPEHSGPLKKPAVDNEKNEKSAVLKKTILSYDEQIALFKTKKTDTNCQQIIEIEYWKHEIDELEKYFGSVTFPLKVVKLNQCTSIIDVPKFIESHLSIVKANKGKLTYLPYLDRLKKLKDILHEETLILSS
jgi:hypothetical protein